MLDTALPESEIALSSWTVTEESIKQYLSAVGDAHVEYCDWGLVPPLALAAHALGALLEKLALPPGAIHSLQEIESRAAVRFGEEIAGVARLERPRLRGNLQFITAVYTLWNGSGQCIQKGKSTVLVPGGQDTERDRTR